MPLQKILFKPGVNRENTRYTTEGGWYECDKVRFRQGNPEIVGGWVPFSLNTFMGACRSLWNWVTLANQNLIGLGTNLKFYIQQGQAFNDVTPIRVETLLGTNPFTGDNTTTVVVTAPDHGAVNDDFVTFSGVAGLYANLLNGEFQITYIDSNSYSIEIASAIPVGTTGGSAVMAAYQINTGAAYNVPLTGWGAGAWGEGAWGIGVETTDPMRLWSQMNYGQNLVFGPRGGGIYFWEPENYLFNRAELLNSLGGPVTITLASPAVVTATKIFTEGTALQFGGNLPGGMLPNTTYYVFNVNGLSFNLLDGSGNLVNTLNTASLVGNAAYGIPGTVTASVTLTPQLTAVTATTSVGSVSVSNLTLQGVTATTSVGTVATKGGALTGVTANVATGAVVAGPTVELSGNTATGAAGVVSKSGTVTAFISKIVDVPTVQNVIFVSDTSRFIFAMGCNDYGLDAIDPMLIRWSDQDNPYIWTPDASNQAGSVRLSHGSEIITAVQTRQEIVVFTDSSLYSLQYLGPPFVWNSQLLGDNISIAGPNAAMIASGVVYWMGVDKFYAYDGRVQTLPCNLRRYVFNDFNLAQSQQVYAGTNEAFNEVWWFYCSANSNQIDKYVVYNYLENIWYYGTLDRTAWFDSGLLNYPIATTYDPATQTGRLISHENGLNDDTNGTAQPINAYISSSEFDIGDGHNFGFVWRVLPDLTFSNSTNSSTNAAPRVDMTLYGLYNSGSGSISDANQNVIKGNTYVITEEFTGQIYTRVRGRQMIFKISSNQLNTAWQLGAPRIDIRPDGRR